MGAYNRRVMRDWLGTIPEQQRQDFLARLDPFWRERYRRDPVSPLVLERLVLLAEVFWTAEGAEGTDR